MFYDIYIMKSSLSTEYHFNYPVNQVQDLGDKTSTKLCGFSF